MYAPLNIIVYCGHEYNGAWLVKLYCKYHDTLTQKKAFSVDRVHCNGRIHGKHYQG